MKRIGFLGPPIAVSLLLATLTGGCGSKVEETVNVSQNSGQSLVARIAADSQGSIHVVWHDNTEGHDNILYAARLPDGDWSQPLNLSHSEVYARQASLTIDSQDTIHVAWQGTEVSGVGTDIFYTCKSRGGDWSQPVNLTHSERRSEGACLVADPKDTLHLVYNQDTDTGTDIFYTFRPKGEGWSAPVNVSNDESRSGELSLAVDKAGWLHLAWSAEHEGNWQVFYKSLTPDGQWSASVNVSNNEGESRNPRLAVDSQNNAHIVWHDDSASKGTWDILYIVRSSGGDWQPTANLTEDTSGIAGFPCLVVDSEDRFHVAFNYQWPSGNRNYDILYRTKPEGGRWSRAVNVSHSDSQSGDSAIAVVRGGGVYIAYADQTPGNWDIFIARIRN